MIAIINYGMGNLFSIENALNAIGAESIVSSRAEDLRRAERIILPGVGAFPSGMENLKNLGLIEVLKEEVLKKQKPFLGICLGMQLLAEEGEEHKLTAGLGLIAGRVVRFNVNEKEYRIPHVGWNNVEPAGGDILFKNIEHPVFYFVHSYHFIPADRNAIIGICNYGERFAAAVRKNNIFGVQFHPEKSQQSGLQVLRNFIAYKNANA